MYKSWKSYWKIYSLKSHAIFALEVVSLVVISWVLLLLCSQIFDFFIPVEFTLTYMIGSFILVLIWKQHKFVGGRELRKYIHGLYPQLQYSLALLEKKNLNSLEQIQAASIADKLPSPFALKTPYKKLFISILLPFVFIVFFSWDSLEGIGVSAGDVNVKGNDTPTSKEVAASPNEKVAYLFEYSLEAKPPFYTNLSDLEVVKDTTLLENTNLLLEAFVRPDSIFGSVGIIINDDTIQSKKGSVERQVRLKQSTLIDFFFQSPDTVISSESIFVKVIQDRAPDVKTDLAFNEYNRYLNTYFDPFSFTIEANDDFGIKTVNLIATLSRGKGEAVTFQEYKFNLGNRFVEAKTSIKFQYEMPLDSFDIKSGDELYFFIEAIDNRQPNNNQSRSDVYFINFKDSAEQQTVDFEGMALEVEAEYFKSQRQIIIDTEQLLQNRKQLSSSEFREKSNQIGIDQKLLRLRYGKFLGEEFEQNLGSNPQLHRHEKEEKEEKKHDNDHTDHDHDNHDHAHDEGHSHQHTAQVDSETDRDSEFLEPYLHLHEDNEVSTFYDAQLKRRLKKALKQMWQAELYLRTAKAELALPYEYEALKLIKEIQQASRIYVERIGFEPPSFSISEKRLSGELDEIDPSSLSENKNDKSLQDRLSNIVKQLTTASSESSSIVWLKKLNSILVEEMTNHPVDLSPLLLESRRILNQEVFTDIPLIIKVLNDFRYKTEEAINRPDEKNKFELLEFYREDFKAKE